MRAPKNIEEDIQKILDKFQLRRNSPQNFFTTNAGSENKQQERQSKMTTDQQ